MYSIQMLSCLAVLHFVLYQICVCPFPHEEFYIVGCRRSLRRHLVLKHGCDYEVEFDSQGQMIQRMVFLETDVLERHQQLYRRSQQHTKSSSMLVEADGQPAELGETTTAYLAAPSASNGPHPVEPGTTAAAADSLAASTSGRRTFALGTSQETGGALDMSFDCSEYAPSWQQVDLSGPSTARRDPDVGSASAAAGLGKV